MSAMLQHSAGRIVSRGDSTQKSQISLAFRPVESFLKPVDSKLTLACTAPEAKIGEPEDFCSTAMAAELTHYCDEEFSHRFIFSEAESDK